MSQFGTVPGDDLKGCDAFCRHRMRLEIGIGILRGEQDLVGQPPEGVSHALCRLAGGGEEFHAAAIGLLLLGTLVGQQGTPDGLLRAENGSGRVADIAAAASGGDRAANSEDHGDDRRRLRLCKLLAQPRQVSAGDVTGFVREHADHLVWNLCVNQRSGVDEDSLGIDHEGVERAVVDDGDLNVLLREAGGAQDGLRVVAQQLFDLGVADDGKSGRQALRARRCRRDGHRRRNRDRECRQQRKRMRGWRPPPHPDSASAVDHVRSKPRAQFEPT